MSDDDKTARAAFRTYIEGHERLSGELTLDIEARTPLFIGGNVSNGKGEDFNDEHIYYRCLMTTKSSPPWMNALNKLYNDRMTNTIKGKDGKRVPVKNARPGFLIKLSDESFWIAPSIYAHDRKDDRINFRDFKKIFPNEEKSAVLWKNKTAYVFTGHNKNKKYIRFTSIDHVDWDRKKWFELSDELRLSYKHDRNRGGVDLFSDKGILNRKKLESLAQKNLPADVETLVPCHFLEKDGAVTAFGHGQCFRIPYLNSIGDAIPNALKSDLIDFADAMIRGYKLYWHNAHAPPTPSTRAQAFDAQAHSSRQGQSFQIEDSVRQSECGRARRAVDGFRSRRQGRERRLQVGQGQTVRLRQYQGHDQTVRREQRRLR